MTPVCFLQLPFAALERPSLGLGLLARALTKAGIGVQVAYPNLDFAARVGLARYRLVELTRNDDLLGEWVFKRAAFREEAPPDGDFWEKVDLAAPSRRLGSRAAIREAFESMRTVAEEWVEELARSLAAAPHSIVGASSMFQQHCASLAVLRRLKELRPEVTAMLGGANCEGVMGKAAFASFPWLDYVVCGEADDVIVELVRAVLGRRVAEVPEGVLQRGRPAGRAARPLVDDLDALPVPDFTHYFAALERSPLRNSLAPGLLLETSRGCWWGQKHHCTFCGLNGTGMAFRSKSAGRILTELKELSERYGLTRFELTDNILAMERFRDLLPGLAARDYSLFAEVKANLRREHLQALAEAGVRWIQPGLESMHDEVLKLMDKGTTTAVNLQLLKWAREFGVFVSWNFLVGFPGEEDDWYAGVAEWLPLVAHLQPPQGVFRARFDRYSPYQVDPARYGLTVVPHPAYRAIYPGDVTDLAYFHLGADQEWGPTLWDAGLMGPGRRALEEAARRWGEAFWSPLPAILSMDDDGEELRVLDTRPGAAVRRRSLRGAERAVYLACDVARTVRACAQEAGLAPEVAREVLDELCAARLMLALADGRYLALAVRGDLPRLLRPEEFPGGACLVAPGLEGPAARMGEALSVAGSRSRTSPET